MEMHLQIEKKLPTVAPSALIPSTGSGSGTEEEETVKPRHIISKSTEENLGHVEVVQLWCRTTDAH